MQRPAATSTAGSGSSLHGADPERLSARPEGDQLAPLRILIPNVTSETTRTSTSATYLQSSDSHRASVNSSSASLLKAPVPIGRAASTSLVATSASDNAGTPASAYGTNAVGVFGGGATMSGGQSNVSYAPLKKWWLETKGKRCYPTALEISHLASESTLITFGFNLTTLICNIFFIWIKAFVNTRTHN